ncbi:Crp/Fnr family transcriptional regulator [Paucibacter soli]|uniref:Crp/Fnr family transcriptional regulator n=1 Tax=Paucibacter soli TaxID=3133433 RepID=UPI00309A04F5
MTTTPCPVCGPAFLDWLQQDAERLAQWRALPRRRLARGQRWPGEGLAWVERGLLRGMFIDAQGRERNHAFYPELQWLGLPGAVGAAAAVAAPAIVEALEPSELVELSGPALHALQHAWPQALELILRGLAAGLARQTAREQQLLMLDATARYQRFLADEPALAQRLALKQVASYLGITEVALSRLRRRLREAGPAIGVRS